MGGISKVNLSVRLLPCVSALRGYLKRVFIITSLVLVYVTFPGTREPSHLEAESWEPLCTVLSVTFSLTRTWSLPQPPFLCLSYPLYLFPSCLFYSHWFSFVLSSGKYWLLPHLHNPAESSWDTVSKWAEYHVTLLVCSIRNPSNILSTDDIRALPSSSTVSQECFKICLNVLNFRETLKKLERETALKVKYLNWTLHCGCPLLWLCPHEWKEILFVAVGL